MSPADPATGRLLQEIAEEIADGRPVDWEERSSRMHDPEVASRLQTLRVLEGLAQAFRTDSDAAMTEEMPIERPSVLFTWGQLEVREKLGEGGFGEVFRAYDDVLDREVALKLRKAGPSREEGGGQGYIQEARRLASLRHPNVVAVYGADAQEGRVGFWTDLIDGENLAEIVEEQGTMGAEEAAAIGRAVCRALAAVHGAGLVHGDIKPSNVMRERGGRIVLMDFGATSVLRERMKRQESEPIQGTPVVMAPEVLKGELPSQAADIYGLGALLYFLVSGKYPVPAGSFRELLARHRAGEVVPLRDRRPDLPRQFVEVVERALDPDPENRYPSAGAMERALSAVLREERASHEAAAQVAAEARPRRRWLWAAAVLIAVAAGILLWSGRAEEGAAGASAAGHLRLEELHAFSTMPGSHGQVTFSPEDGMIALVRDARGTPQVFVQSLAGGDPIQITHGQAAASGPDWTVDNQIVYALDGDGIWTVPALGGEPRQIVAAGRSPDVSPDGSRIVYEWNRRLWTVSTDGGTPQRIASVPRRAFWRAWATPSFSPDGQRIVYFMAEAGPTGDLWVVPTAGGEPRRLTHDRVQAGDPIWTPDGDTVVFWSRRAGSQTLWRVPAAGGTPRPLTSGAGEDSDPAISPDGARLAFTNTRDRFILTALDPVTGEERQLLSQRQMIWVPNTSPDGTQITFFHPVGPGYHLFTIGLDGSGLRQATSGERAWNVHPHWSPDGSALYYYELRPDPAFRRIPAQGGESQLVAAGWTWPTKNQAAPSPDESRIAYVDYEMDPPTTMIWDRETGERLALPLPHLNTPQWSADGQRILGWNDGGTIRICPADGGACREVAKGYRPRFAVDGEWIYFHRQLEAEGMWEIWRMRSDGSEQERLGVTGPHRDLDPTFAMAAGGQVVYTRYVAAPGEIWIGSLRGDH